MDWAQLEARIAVGEDEHTELKRGPGDLRPIGRAISAIANTDGGLVILGVDDNGNIVGVREDPESVSERLTGFLQSGLNAPVQARLGQHRDANGWIHWVEVPRQRGFEPLSHDGRVFVRRARASVQPSPQELQDLYNLFGYIITEERAIASAGIEAIEVQSFWSYLDRLGLDRTGDPQPGLEDDLLARGVLAEIGGDLRATLYGALAFGKTPQSYPQTGRFWVECVSYGGKDRADEVLQVAEGKGRLDEQVDRALGWVRGLGRGERYEGITRIDMPLVPRAAVREALVNAVAHRDYAIIGSQTLLEVFSDRLVVTSPGVLPTTVTVESVKRGGRPRSRNESIANYLLAMQKMERRGRGWLLMRRAMLEHNGTEPEIEEDREARWVSVTLWLRPPQNAAESRA
ncbi:MAG: putative DNA binding domain-containing protein [Candidatus Schekmanbacteria bacterium]|nr:putative DNA binding domain-containing protein [Candidatus Schekmanbacteria bacterium]